MTLRALLANDASLAGHHGSALVTQRCVALAREAGVALITGWDWPSVEEALAGAHPFDLVIVNGEGSIHHDSRTAVRVAELARTLRRRGTPAYLVNASVEAVSANVLDGLAAFRLSFARDRASVAILQQAGVEAGYAPDLTLTWPDAPAWSGGARLFVTDASDRVVAQRLMALARTWTDATPVSLRCPPPAPARGSGRRRLAYRVKRWLGAFRRDDAWSIRHGGAYPSLQELANAFARDARGLVSGRYHAVCLALRIGVPFVSIEGNIGKVGGLLADAGLSGRLVSLESLEQAESAPDVPAFTADERGRIAAFLAAADERARAMFAQIARDASSG